MNSVSMFDLNKTLRDIKLKKQYKNKLKIKLNLLKDVKEKNYKFLDLNLKSNNHTLLDKENFLVKYIINITFSRTNTLLHVMDFSGQLKFFCSAGSLKYTGKRKKARYAVFRDLYKVLVTKLTFLKNQPVALHLKNVRSVKTRIIRLLKKKFFVKVVRSYTTFPHNGCRKRKMRRKKF